MKWNDILQLSLWLTVAMVVQSAAAIGAGDVGIKQVDFLMLSSSLLPEADFQLSARSGTVPFTVRFDASLSRNAQEYEWFFGDDATTAQGVQVEHTYTEAGIYSIILRVRSGKHEDYVHTYIQADTNQAITDVPGYNPSDSLNFFKRNRQYIQNELYYLGVSKMLDYVSLDDIRATLIFSWPVKESVLYAKYSYDSEGRPKQALYGGYVALNFNTGEAHTFDSRALSIAQTRAITADAHHVIYGLRHGEVYIVNTLTGKEEVMFMPDIEGDADRMYDTLNLAVNPEGTEVTFVLHNIVTDGPGGIVSELPHYVISLPITARNQTLASVEPLITIPFGTEEFREFHTNQIVWWKDRWYVLMAAKSLEHKRLEDAERLEESEK